MSVLVPVYNVEDYIERCARSVLEQTYGNLEIIFVDDGCTDRSVRVLEQVINEYPQQHGRVRLISHETNKGLSATRNTLVYASTGEFVYHADADDWIEPFAIEKLVQKQIETQADIVVGQCLVYENDENIYIPRRLGGELAPKAYIKAFLTHQIYSVVIWNRLIRKSLYTDNQIRWDETVRREDNTAIVKVYYFAKSTAFIDDVTYHYDKRRVGSIMNKQTDLPTLYEEMFKYDDNITSFLFDKEQYLLDAVAGYSVHKMHFLLVESVTKGKKAPYSFVLKKMKEEKYRKYWSSVGWDNPFVYFIESHWFVFRTKKFLGRLKWGLWGFFK